MILVDNMVWCTGMSKKTELKKYKYRQKWLNNCNFSTCN